MNRKGALAKQQEVLRGINTLTSSIATRLSHEFRTPLTCIIGFAELLLTEVDISEEKRREYASYIRDEGERLSSVVNEIVAQANLQEFRDRTDT